MKQADLIDRPYDRPGSNWSCGRVDSCPCSRGPDAKGNCPLRENPCKPRLSIRTKRMRLSLSIVLVSLMTVLFCLYKNSTSDRFIIPGQLSHNHSNVLKENNCSACHSLVDNTDKSWRNTAFLQHSSLNDSSKCIECHTFTNKN